MQYLEIHEPGSGSVKPVDVLACTDSTQVLNTLLVRSRQGYACRLVESEPKYPTTLTDVPVVHSTPRPAFPPAQPLPPPEGPPDISDWKGGLILREVYHRQGKSLLQLDAVKMWRKLEPRDRVTLVAAFVQLVPPKV